MLVGFGLFTKLPIVLADEIPNDVKSAFAPWTVKQPFRHRFDQFEIKSFGDSKTLVINLWYETASVTKTGQPDTNLLCRIVHTAVFGRHLDRSRAKELPLALAFKKIPSLSEVKIQFFTQYLTNKPLPPEWAQKPSATATQSAEKSARLRVIWGREEKIVNYLSYSIQKGEWQTVANLIRSSSNSNHEDFANNLCPSILKVAPNLKVNFTEVNDFLTESRGGSKRQ